MSRGLHLIDVLNGEGVNGALTVGLTAVELKVGASVLNNRQSVTMQARDNNIYWGYSNAVTTSNGTQLFKNQFLLLPIGAEVSVWLIADGAGKEVRIGELA